MEIAGVEMEETPFGEESPQKKEKKKESHSIKEMSGAALNLLLKKALEREDYEKAAEIRDELNRRQDEEEN